MRPNKEQDLYVEVKSQVVYPSQGVPCSCDNDDEHYWINCMFHLVHGYGVHEVGYGCFRCGAHYFYQADWANAEDGCFASAQAVVAVDPVVRRPILLSTRVKAFVRKYFGRGADGA